jgi:hypothetical protein
MIRAGFKIDEEPYLESIVKVISLRRFQDLRVMARIPVEDGQYALGVMDEYGILKPGQVFYRRSLDQYQRFETIVGRIAVSRSPALHPGDIRFVDAVDCSGTPPFGFPPKLHIIYVRCFMTRRAL